MRSLFRLTPLLAALLLGACTTIPTGPSMLVMPGSSKEFRQFRATMPCVGNTRSAKSANHPDQAAVDSGVRSAAVGTVLGAAAGAAIDGGHGAAVRRWDRVADRRAGRNRHGTSGPPMTRKDAYDYAYVQCMYAQGHRVPVSGRYETAPRRSSYPPPPPPPPRGTPPPPLPERRPLRRRMFRCVEFGRAQAARASEAPGKHLVVRKG